ncbi:MAG: helix-turn-helix transcriptional regulator [Armatimonadetes bacterium]|nr:helix-turn-helix transcriptional regulator [Armatimonadota bacterium]
MNNQPKQAFGPTINRFLDVMAHSDRFAFRGSSRLAFDAGVNPSTLSRILYGEINPSFALVARLTGALEKEFGLRFDPRDLVAENGEFLTPFTCDLVGCPGCLPDKSHDGSNVITPEFRSVKPASWVTSRYPKGFRAKGGK